MPTATKGDQVRVWLQPEESALLVKLAELSGLTQTAIAGTVLSAALKAMAQEGLKLEYPLRFKIDRNEEKPIKPRA